MPQQKEGPETQKAEISFHRRSLGRMQQKGVCTSHYYILQQLAAILNVDMLLP